MTKFDSFLRTNDLEGTATNKYGEAVYLGKANTVKHTKYAYNIIWDIPEVTSTSSLDKIILHNGSKVFGVINMPFFRLDGHTKVQVTVK
jgi:hypothetical protein